MDLHFDVYFFLRAETEFQDTLRSSVGFCLGLYNIVPCVLCWSCCIGFRNYFLVLFKNNYTLHRIHRNSIHTAFSNRLHAWPYDLQARYCCICCGLVQ